MPAEWEGLNEARVLLKSLPERFARVAVAAAADAAHGSLSDWADDHRQSGAMQRSIGSRVEDDHADVWIGAPHARFVAFGTKPHIITPRKKKALRWVQGGHFRFARLVNHPGYKGDNPVPDAFAAASRAAFAALERSPS